MSRILVQTKSLLPVVLTKRTSDALQVLQKYPSFATAQTEELLKQEPKKTETPIDFPKQETPKLEAINKEVLSSVGPAPKDNLKMVIRNNPEMHVVGLNKIPGDNEIPTPIVDQSSQPAKVVTVESSNQKTLLKALILDLLQLQRSLGALLSEVHLRLSQHLLKDQVVSDVPGTVRVVQPKPKETEPVPVLTVAQKKDQNSKSESEAVVLKSNLWEAVQENSPAWQTSISLKLGNLQKVVVEKLAK